jgi:hypothetical protein
VGCGKGHGGDVCTISYPYLFDVEVALIARSGPGTSASSGRAGAVGNGPWRCGDDRHLGTPSAKNIPAGQATADGPSGRVG